MATPGATAKGNLESCPVHADGGAPRRRWRAPRRVAVSPRHTRTLAAAFPHLPPSLLGEMAQSLEEARFRPGEVIVREGDPAGRLAPRDKDLFGLVPDKVPWRRFPCGQIPIGALP